MKSLNLISAIILSLSFLSANAQISGDWIGAIEVQETEIELIFHIIEVNGTYSATMDLPSQGAAGIDIGKVEFVDNQLFFSIPQMQLLYKGVLEGETIEGVLEQGDVSLPFNLFKFVYSLPGDTSLPSPEEELKKLAEYDKGNFKYTIEDYFSSPKANFFQLSPNGKYLSYMEKDDNNKNHVYVKEIATGKVQRAIEGKNELIRSYGWISNERLFYSIDQARK